ncbi:hypothetical protein C5P10_24590, partial [Escherichia coli]
MHSWKKKLVVSQLALACTLAITSQANAATNDISGQTYNTFHHYNGFAPIFPDTCYHLTHYWPAAADIPVASDNPVHYADAIRYNAR